MAAENREREMRSLHNTLQDLEFKTSVASTEIAKWTDNTLQVVQYILSAQHHGDCDNSAAVSLPQLVQQFPYLESILAEGQSDTSCQASMYNEKLIASLNATANAPKK